ncbi:hypothetical protein AJ85_17000 [Alkalihalobacillus alcalophilus ATCC 27647 = CGMCC 1.3604]|uniref:Flagellar hook-associated protein 1 n=1 Tax=Alkalihalobacillus alcalophilus ATCC 27647 = CGMCC 1.3604 TaxID=1218173 RepID=A0A094WHJ5_ALKAL|nr:flagellar hook-associated protein FlgK [Alkalihalobacillus alcalophilus]KGA97239.1 hypothetical protein BALCAV_0211590 [Alkalihalobacillus alcalophilus ATCC 27647 = CGMCC 1.3604]MED1561515.1 flagellar hook-associated protein FlgK [Alkalihalobacillus alcalophilus]THG89524.1 hypothetical protein AJ85_17000 [Alkalihalobacillus alcalophilus ATCC 27647 = CGMCC 1.3604]
MLSTFTGLETARRALMTQQKALYTLGHNVANANTQGYSRQRVNFQTTEAYPSAGMNSPAIPGSMGTGVKAGSIQRVRDQFLDVQFRNENNKTGYWNSRYLAFEKMESILNEPSTDGLAAQIESFWSAFQDLVMNPAESGERSVIRETAKALTETFNYLSDSLTQVQSDYQNELEVNTKDLNSLLTQLNNVNKQIRDVEPHGYVPNDLYDEQDRLLDEISGYINISTERMESKGQPNSAAEGAVTLYFVDANGTKHQLVNGADHNDLQQLEIESDEDGHFVSMNFGTQSFSFEEMSNGALKGIVEALGYVTESGEVKGTYPDMLAELDEMAWVFAERINQIHQIGFTLPDINGEVHQGGLFFDFKPGAPDETDPKKGAAARLIVAENLNDSIDNIAAAGVNKEALVDKDEYERLYKQALEAGNYEELIQFLGNDGNFKEGVPKAFPGDASNAALLADAKKMQLHFGTKIATIGGFYQGLIGKMAVDTKEAGRMLANSANLLSSVDYNRQSVSNVSLDEELTLMIQYQHAYSAAARNITMVDEMLDTIINRMGLVGR